MSKKISLIIIFIVSTFISIGQQYSEFTVELGGGLSSIKYQLNSGKQNYGFGGDVGLGFTYFLTKHFGIGTGAEISLYNSKIDMSGNNTTIFKLTDSYLEEYQLNTLLANYTETQRAFIANIPFYIKFQGGKNHKFYFQPGINIGIPINIKYQYSGANFFNTAYYESLNNTISAPTFQGLGDFANRSGKGNLKFNIAFSILADIGIKWNISDKIALYTGIYATYNFNNTLQDWKQDFVKINKTNPPDFSTNSLLSTRIQPNNPFIEKANLISVGFKIKLAFQFAKKETSKNKKEKNKKGEENKKSEDDLEKRAAELYQKYLDEIERIKSEQTEANNTIEQQKAEQQKAEQQRIEQQRVEQQKVEQQRLEQQRIEQQKAEQQRLEQQRIEQQKAEQQRVEKQKAEQQRLKQQQIEQEKAEQQRVEQLRIEQQRAKEYQEQYLKQKEADLAKLNNYTINNFEFTESNLNLYQKEQLSEIIYILSKYPEVKIICTGHTDERGSDDKNNEVGYKRAKVVKEYLVQNGISSNRILPLSKSQSEPLFPNTNEENRAINRRVVITISN
ncbi:MAG: OmpA family protein [Bacteroidales bacterium]|jgi:outer membrane protein OmpA-like peptidoglycan-associated protein|nr:OmpA family protein [Bacteroidales bacterium]